MWTMCISDNCIVVIGRAVGVDYKRLAHVIRSSDLILTYFAYGEYIARQTWQQERESDRFTGVICMFDLGGLNIAECVLSGSALLYISRMCFDVMQKWYTSQGLRALLFLNPPKVMCLFWKMARLVMNETTRRAVHLITNPHKQLPTLLHPDAIPVAFGGNLKDESGWSDPEDICVNRPRHILPEDYLVPGEFWMRETGRTVLDLKVARIRKSACFTVEKCATDGSEKLVWIFWVNGEIDLEILHGK